MPTFNSGYFDPNIFDAPEAGPAFQADAFQADAFQIGGTSASAEVAAGTGDALGAAASVAPSAGEAAGSGSAYDATVSFDVNTNADAEVAAGTGVASNAVPSVAPNAGVSAGSGAAYNATVSTAVSTSAGVAAGTGAAYNAAVQFAISASAGAAIGTGTAYGATISSPIAHAGVATGTGTASDASASFTGTVPGTDPGATPLTSIVSIIIDGVDYGPIAHFPTCRFESLVNAQPGRGFVRLRDDDRTLTFLGGETVLVKINGENVWRGFVTQPKRVYIAPALNIDDFGLTRFLDLECTDINILFKKRIIFNQSNPANGYGTLFPDGTADLTAIQNMLAGFIDLSGDGLNTTALVENVADINVDQEARAWKSAIPWGQAMASIASLPGAIYYIDPDKNFVYTDVDTPNAPFGLSDQPDGSTTKGYSSMEVLKDGTVLANDVMAWGIGYNPEQVPVFERLQDAPSIAEHGVWQRGEIRYGIYKQATIDRVADSIVYGSPSNKRGAKDDRLTVALTTYESGLRVAQKVDFTSNVFDFNDVIPVRKMVITFEAPYYPRYDIVLSHEIDPPWSFVDPFFLDFGPPSGPKPPKPPPPKKICLDDNPDTCGITDTFTRTVTDTTRTSAGTTILDLGTSDSGYEYNPIYTNITIDSGTDPITSGVNGSAWRTTIGQATNGAGGAVIARLTPAVQLGSSDRSFTFTLTTPGVGDWCLRIIFDGLGFGFGSSLAGYGVSGAAYITINPSGTSGVGPINDSEIGFTSGAWTTAGSPPWSIGTPTSIPGSFWTTNDVFTYTISHDDTTMTTTISNSTASFSNTQAHGDLTGWVLNPGIALVRSLSFGNLNNLAPWIVEIDNLNIPEVNSCSSRLLDDFQRVGSDWNTSSSGLEWVESFVQFADFTTSNEGILDMPYANAFSVPSGGTNELFDVPFTGAMTMEALLSISAVDSVGRIFFYLADADYNDFVDVELLVSAGTVNLGDGTNTGTASFGDWTDDQEFWVKWEWTPGVSSKVKLWNSDGTEPATWLIQASAISLTTGIFGFHGVNSRGFTPNGGQDTAIAVQQISIDWDYPRTICDTPYTNWDDMGAWLWFSGAGDGVAGNEGLDPGWGTNVDNQFYLKVDPDVAAEVGVLDRVAIELTYADDPSLFDYLQGGPFTISSDFVLPANPGRASDYTVNWALTISFDDLNKDFTLDVSYGETALEPGGGGTTNVTATLSEVPTVNNDRLYFTNTVLNGPFTLTVTPDLITATGLWGELSIVPNDAPLDLTDMTAIRISHNEGASGSFNQINAGEWLTGSIFMESLTQGPQPWCGPQPPGPEECFDTFVGFPFFEDVTVTAGKTNYNTSTNYMENSLTVLVNGLIQRPGTDYTETDPATGAFTLLFSPSATDTIRVIYQVGP